MFLLWLRHLPQCGDRTPASVPHTPRASPALLTLLSFPLVPSSYRVLCGSVYSFLLVRYSCLLSAGILHALLCLKVYSWCICGERCTPHLPTALSSCSLLFCYTIQQILFPGVCVCVCVCMCVWGDIPHQLTVSYWPEVHLLTICQKIWKIQ